MSINCITNKIYIEVNNYIMIRLTIDKALEKRNITRYELSKRTGIHYQIIDNYYKNKVKRYDSYVLDRICEAIECDASELIEYVK